MEKSDLLDEKLTNINERIACIENHLTDESASELGDLYSQREYDEFKKYDLEHGTHKARLSELLAEEDALYARLLDEKEERTKKSRRVTIITYLKIKKTQFLIDYYSNLDSKNISRNLKM